MSGSKIINIKKSAEEQKSISIDQELFALLSAKMGGDKEAAALIRKFSLTYFRYLSSSQVRKFVLFEICDPKIKEAYYKNREKSEE